MDVYANTQTVLTHCILLLFNNNIAIVRPRTAAVKIIYHAYRDIYSVCVCVRACVRACMRACVCAWCVCA